MNFKIETICKELSANGGLLIAGKLVSQFSLREKTNVCMSFRGLIITKMARLSQTASNAFSGLIPATAMATYLKPILVTRLNLSLPSSRICSTLCLDRSTTGRRRVKVMDEHIRFYDGRECEIGETVHAPKDSDRVIRVVVIRAEIKVSSWALSYQPHMMNNLNKKVMDPSPHIALKNLADLQPSWRNVINSTKKMHEKEFLPSE